VELKDLIERLDHIIALLEKQTAIMEGPCDCAAEQLRYPRCLEFMVGSLSPDK